MKLSAENIQFIDSYLKNSGVMYFDIRMEMLDHVATAVELKMESENLDFYDAFKNYMVENKKELMKENEKTQKYNYSVLLPFLKFSAKPLFLVLFVVLEFLFYQLSKIYDMQILCSTIAWSIFGSLLLLILIQALYYYFSHKKRLYYIEKNASIFFVIYQPTLVLNNAFLIGKGRVPSIWVGYFLVFFATFFIIYIFYYISELKKIKSKNKFFFQ